MMIEVVCQRAALLGGGSAHKDVLVVRVSLRDRKSKQGEHEHHDQPRDSHDPHAWADGICGKPKTRRSDIGSALWIWSFPCSARVSHIIKALVDRIRLSLLLRTTPPRVFCSQVHGEVVYHSPGKTV